MSIPFNQIPATIRLPGARYEINTGERPYQGRSRLLIIAPKLAAGTALAGVPVRLPSDPLEAFGDGSIAAEMAVLARRQAPLFEIWVLPVTDPAGTKSTATIKVDSVPVPGTYPFWVLGRERSVTVVTGDTATTLAAKIATAAAARWFLPGLSGSLAMPVTAAAVTDTVTLTCRHNGDLLSAPWVDKQLYGTSSPLTSALTIAYPVTGTGDPDMAAVLAGIGDLDADWIASAFGSASARSAIDNFLADRWGPIKQRYGIAVYANQGTSGALAALAAAQNTFRAIQIGQRDSPDPSWAILAQAAADLAQFYDMGAALTEAQVLARPPNGRVLRDLHPPRGGFNGFTDDERNALYFDGVGPLTVDASGKVTFELVPTMYQTDSVGLDDPNFLWLNYPLIYVYTVRYFRNFVWSRHANTSIVGDDVPPRPGQSTVRSITDSHRMAYLKLRNEAGLVEDFEGFAARLVVERSSDPTRVNVLLPVDAANPLHVLATNVQASAQFQS